MVLGKHNTLIQKQKKDKGTQHHQHQSKQSNITKAHTATLLQQAATCCKIPHFCPHFPPQHNCRLLWKLITQHQCHFTGLTVFAGSAPNDGAKQTQA